MEDIFEKCRKGGKKKSFFYIHSSSSSFYQEYIGILWGRNKLSTSNDAIHIFASANVQHATFDTSGTLFFAIWNEAEAGYCIRIFLTNIYCSI
jgi:hypothetical protein